MYNKDKMSISYHGVVGFKSKVTLPSVETWGTNMSMLRDPPKSIQTRKIDKVGETSDITQMIQESGDRVNEMIKVYARGVNPMVAVDYGGVQGTMGGQYYGGQSNSGTKHTQAFLPYRIADHGAVRLSYRDPRTLIPLSKQPRAWTSSFTQPGFTDFSKTALCQNTNGARSVKAPEMGLKACIRPTATFHLETPITEPYEIKYVIKNPLHVAGNSGKNITARFNGEMGEPVKQIVENPLRPDVHVSLSDTERNIDLSGFDTGKYTHELLHVDAQANPSRNVQTTSIDELFNVNTESHTKDLQNINYTAPLKGYENYEYLNTDVDLERVLPYHESHTNSGRNIHKRLDNQHEERIYVPNRPNTSMTTNQGMHRMPAQNEMNDRRYVLKPTVNPGGMEPSPSMPMLSRENEPIEFDTAKVHMRQRIYDMQQDRNISLGNTPFVVG